MVYLTTTLPFSCANCRQRSLSLNQGHKMIYSRIVNKMKPGSFGHITLLKWLCTHSLNFIRLLRVVITPSVTTLLRGENDSKQSDEIQAIAHINYGSTSDGNDF